MKIQTKILTILTSFGIGSLSYSQNVTDVVRYSNTQFQGTARFEAMGGSFGALGADLSSNLINPAGFGRYSSSQLALSLNNSTIINTGKFEGMETDYSRNVFKPTNLGIVIATDVSYKNKGFMFNQIGFTYNRVENFNNKMGYKGKMATSLLDVFAADSYGLAPEALNPFSGKLAYETYAMDPNSTNTGYIIRVAPGDSLFHDRFIDTKGGISEYTFSYSFNYLNKLYFGLNLGIRSLNYRERYTHREEVINPIDSLESFDYKYELNTKGSGTNLKIGVIYLPVEQLRIGLALQTPTYYNLRDLWTADMTTYQKGGTVFSYPIAPPIGDYKYRLRTPGKITGSLAYVFGTRGSVNIDVEYMDYRWGNLKNTRDRTYEKEPYNYEYQNREIDDLLRPVVNLRIGGELVFNSIYFIRAGFALYPQPYRVDDNKAMTSYSAGAGVKLGKWSFDLAYKLQHRYYNYYAYPDSKTQFNTNAHNVVLTFAFNF